MWLWRAGLLPQNSIRDGLPSEREAMAEMLAELLFDCDVVGGQLELVLPLEGSHWRGLEGLPPEMQIQPSDLLAINADLNWPLESDDSYVALTPCVDQMLLVGCSRSHLQAWIDVVEMADLPLRRVDWLVSSAQRGLMHERQQWSGDVAWVFSNEASYRLVVIRACVPELDCCFQLNNDDDLAVELRKRIAAWQSLSGSAPALAWCLCLRQELLSELELLIDPDRGETSIDLEGLWMPKAVLSEDEAQGLQALERLALQGMREDIYR